MMNIQKMMQQAQEMQNKLQEMQEKLADIEVQGEAGGGLVKVTMNCKGQVRAVEIDPSILDDKDMVEDLVVAAMNKANASKEQRIQVETESMMGGMGGMPAGMKLPF